MWSSQGLRKVRDVKTALFNFFDKFNAVLIPRLMPCLLDELYVATALAKDVTFVGSFLFKAE